MMPTAARMVAAVLLAALAWVTSDLIRPLLPEGTNFGIFNQVNATIGFFVGWVFIGPRAGRGFAAGISNGFTSVVILTASALFVQGAYEMTVLSMRHRYGGFVEAIAAIFAIGTEYGATMMVPNVLLTLFFGGCLVGLLTELASRRWS